MIDWAGFVPAAVLVSLIPGVSQLLGLSNAAPSVHRWVDRGCGVCFIGLAGLLAVDEVARPSGTA